MMLGLRSKSTLIAASMAAVILFAWLSLSRSNETIQDGNTGYPIYMQVNGIPVYQAQRDVLATEVRSANPELSAAQIDAMIKADLVKMVVWEQQAEALGVIIPQAEVDHMVESLVGAATLEPETFSTEVMSRLMQDGHSSLEAFATAAQNTYRQSLAEAAAEKTLVASAVVPTLSPQEIEDVLRETRGSIGILSAAFEDEVLAAQFRQEVYAQIQATGLYGSIDEIEAMFYRHVATPTPGPLGIVAIGTTYDLGESDPLPSFVTAAASQSAGYVGLEAAGGEYTVYLVVSTSPASDPTAAAQEIMDKRRQDAVRATIEALSAAAVVTMAP
ncbi:MAG: hypothetical protein IPJ58_07920 [Ardenticatenia bacterium]|nr:hypothetical protein [Ardenticatenia bacterium]